MDKPGQFKAGSWLSCPPISTKSFDLSDFEQNKSQEGLFIPSHLSQNLSPSHFSPAHYCVSGWNGEGLITSCALNISNLIEELSLEALKYLKDKNTLPPSLRRSIYEEFISYALTEEIPVQELESSEIFWNHVFNKDSPHQNNVQNFLKNYAFRTVTVHIFKIRFITQFCRATNKHLDKSNLQNPSSFIEKIFKKGSSTELKCEALQPNQYSWYRPSAEFQDLIFKLAKNFHLISMTQMMKICTYSATEHENEKKRALFDDKEFSHALSHKSFGLFINELILFLPYFLDSKSYPKTSHPTKALRVMNTKYSGKNLSALILSHWLAQEHNLKHRLEEWSELICPSFLGNSFFSGSFVRYCHELQFLTFLSEMASQLNHDPVKLTASVMQKKYEQSGIEACGQYSLLSKEHILHHRIVLNLSDLSPRNPHNALIFRINTEAKALTEDGMLFVMSNQKLFVPSQEDKTRQLLDNFKLEALFNFEDLQGRGEIPTFLYVFTRRHQQVNSIDPSFIPGSRKEQCLTFRVEGELKTFSKFHEWVDYLSSFLSNGTNLHLPVHQANIGENLMFQFHQDFIIDGRMVQSDNEDPQCITHPSFIKNLAQACLPFDKFFRIEGIKEEATNDLLGISGRNKNIFPLLLIVDRSNTEQVRLEITPFETYPAKLEKYGTAYYNYFGLIPKIVDINPNLFREYFATQIGNQVVQISLGGSPSNLRSRIKGLLIPAFFALISRPANEQLSLIKTLSLNCSDLLNQDPRILESQYQHELEQWKEIALAHPWYSLGILIQFKHHIAEALQKIQRQKSSIHFQNPVIVEELVKLKGIAIFPTEHPDLFTELCFQNAQALNATLSSTTLKTSEEGHCSLELKTANEILVRLHAPQLILKFAEFILSKAQGMSVGVLLKSLKLPLNKELELILGNYELVAQTFEKIEQSSSILVETTISREISRSKKY